MKAGFTNRIEQLLEDNFQGTDCFLVDIKAGANNHIQVFIDADSGLKIGRCAKISRMLERHIEEEELLPEKYNLEVSSPGIGQPLVLKRQYVKNIGRKVEVKLKDNTARKGKLTDVDGDMLKLEDIPTNKPGKKTEIKSIEIQLSEIKETKVLVSF